MFLLPLAKGLQQLLPCVSRNWLIRYLVEHTDRLSYLVEIRVATRTIIGMPLKLRAHLWKQYMLHVIRDHLYKFLAGNLIFVGYTSPALSCFIERADHSALSLSLHVI